MLLASSSAAGEFRAAPHGPGPARIPVHLYDYPIYKAGMPSRDWEADALRPVTARQTATFGVHDCSAYLWLDHYDDFVARLSGMTRLRTICQVADELFLCAAE